MKTPAASGGIGAIRSAVSWSSDLRRLVDLRPRCLAERYRGRCRQIDVRTGLPWATLAPRVLTAFFADAPGDKVAAQVHRPW